MIKIFLVITFVFLLLFPGPSYAETGYEQMIRELKEKLQTVSGKEKVDVLNRLCLFYDNTPKQAVEYANRAVNLSEEIRYSRGKAYALLRLARAYWNLKNTKKAFGFNREALAIFEKTQNNRGIYDSLHSLEVFYRYVGSYENALKCRLQCLEISQTLRNKNLIAESLNQTGSLYIRLNNFEKALEYLKRALKSGKEAGNKYRIPYYLNNIGYSYMRLGRNTEALEHLKQALTLFSELGDKIGVKAGMAAVRINIASVYETSSQPHTALRHIAEASRIYKEAGNNAGTCMTLSHFAKNYQKIKNYEKAVYYCREALKEALKVKDKIKIQIVYETCAEVYAAAGNYKEAFKYHKLFTQVKDEQIDENKNRQIAMLQEQYEAEKREKEIEVLTKSNKIQQITRNTFIAGFFLVMVLLIFLFKKYLYLFTFWKKKNYIGHYRVIEKIAAGGMGTIYKAHDIHDKTRELAIKVLREDYFTDEDYKKRFKNEAVIVQQLEHPNIIKIIERGEYEGNLYIAMELLHGKSLSQLLDRDEKPNLTIVLNIMIQVTGAVAKIHEKGIIHRDLKPENIMIVETEDNPYFIKILDFGLAQAQTLTRMTRAGILMGSLLYLPPEYITSMKVSEASDIYALGVIYYRMLSCEEPFIADTTHEIARQILEKKPLEPVKFNPSIPRDLNRLVMRMISKHPGARPAAETVLHELNKIRTHHGHNVRGRVRAEAS